MKQNKGIELEYAKFKTTGMAGAETRKLGHVTSTQGN